MILRKELIVVLLNSYFLIFTKAKLKTCLHFEELIKEGLSYQFIAYLFFIKDSNKYLPISQEQFDKIFELIGIQDFKTRNNASWENYLEFCTIIKSVREFLKTKDKNTTLLDTHFFFELLVGKLKRIKRH